MQLCWLLRMVERTLPLTRDLGSETIVGETAAARQSARTSAHFARYHRFSQKCQIPTSSARELASPQDGGRSRAEHGGHDQPDRDGRCEPTGNTVNEMTALLRQLRCGDKLGRDQARHPSRPLVAR